MLNGFGAVAAAVIACAWALAPLRVPYSAEVNRHIPDGESVPSAEADPPTPPFDSADFQVRLWNAPLDVVATSNEPPEPPPPPPDLELIAIITEVRGRVAALYEIGADRLHLAAPGDRIGRLEVVGVDAGGVDLRDHSRTFRLALTPLPASPDAHLTLGPPEEVHP